MYVEQNKDILALSDTTERFVNIVYDRIAEMFLNYHIISAMIQIPLMYNIDDLMFGRFFGSL